MPAPLRVLHLSHPVDGGVARVLLDVARDQRDRGWAVTVGCPETGELPEQLAHLGIATRAWDARKVKRMAHPARVREVAALVASVDPDVVHLHSASAGLAGRLAIRGRRPTLFTPHGWTWQSSGGAFGRVAVGWERWAQRWCSRIVCVSEAELAAGREHGLALAHGVVVPNGVDVALLQPADRAAARSRLGLPDVPTAVCVARLDEQKGQHVLVAGWPRVTAAVPGARLVLVGDGPARAALTAAAPDGVALVGARSDVADWYAAADVVVFSSVYGEGMPLTPLEAQAAGRALVASDLPGVHEALGPGAGLLVPPGDVAAFADAVVARLRDPAGTDEEGQRGRAHVTRAFDLRRSLDRLAALTAEVAGRPVSAGG